MPNPAGINGHGMKNKPPDDVLKASLLKYQAQKQTQEEKCQSLEADHGYKIRPWKLNREENRLGIPSKRRFKPAVEDVRQAVIDEVQNDLSRGNGPDFIQDQLLHKQSLHVGRDLVTKIMKEYFPDDFVKRFPGKKNIRQNWTALHSVSPFREGHGDGHEKLAPQALKMGDVGFSIYSYKDKWSDAILLMLLVPESRTAVAGGHIFLDLDEKWKCIPVQLTTDKGPGIGYQHAFAVALHDVYAPELDPAVYPPHVVIKSTSNTLIEGLWHHLWEKAGINLKEFILRGKTEYLFDATRPEHKPLFYWIFVPLIEAQLNEFVQWWNHHRIRSQSDKLMPSGHVPANALEYPSRLDGIDCRIPVPKEAVQQLRGFIEEEGASRAECFRWFTDDFNALAAQAHESVGSPNITLQSSWDIFVQLSPLVAQR